MYNCLSIHETVQLIVMHATHTVTLLVRLKCRGNAVQFNERKRERDRERGEKDNIETTKTEKLCRVQSFNRIQQTAPLFISLAVYV